MKILEILNEGVPSRRAEVRQKIEDHKTSFLKQSSTQGVMNVVQQLFPNVTTSEEPSAMSAGYKPSDDTVLVSNRMIIADDGEVYELFEPEFTQDFWDHFANTLSDALTHELIHRDQYSRRKTNVDPAEYHKRRQRQIRSHADYLSQRDEISAHAEEIAQQMLRDHGSKQAAIKALQYKLNQYELDDEEAELDDSGLGKYMSEFGRGHKTRNAVFKQAVQYIQNA